MPLTLPTETNRPDEARTILVDENLSIAITVRRPVLADHFKMDRFGNRLDYFFQRLLTILTSWDVVDADGKVVEISRPNIERLCLYYPQVTRELTLLVNDIYYQDESDVLKNLPSPPLAGGTVPTGETIASKTSSDSGTVSKAASGVAQSSAPTSIG